MAVNAREIADLYQRLTQITDDKTTFNLSNLPNMLEKAVTDNGLFDAATIEAFQKSKDPKDKRGRYIIDLKDSDLIKNIKALINLLHSLSDMNHEFITALLNYLNQNGIKSVYSAAKLGFGYKSQIDQAQVDFMSLLYYIEQIKKLLPNINDVNTQANDKLKNIAAVFADTQFNKIVRSIQLASETQAHMNIEGYIPNIEAENLLTALNSFELRLNIDAIQQISTHLIGEDKEGFDKFSELYIAPDDDNKKAYNASRVINHIIKETISTIGQITLNPVYGQARAQWKDLNEETKNDYIKLHSNIVKINQNLAIIDELRKTSPSIDKIMRRNNDAYVEQKSLLTAWEASLPAASIRQMSDLFNIQDGLSLVTENVVANITSEDKQKYFNKETNLFDVPDHIDSIKKNMMLIYNISGYAQEALNRLNEAQDRAWTLTKIPDVLSILKNVVAMVAQYQKLDQTKIKDDAKKSLQSDLNKIFGEFIPIYNSSIEFAIETEVRLGLKENALLDKADHAMTIIEDNMQILRSLQEKTDLKIDPGLMLARKPFSGQKTKVLRKIKGEIEQQLERYNATKESIKLIHASYKPINFLRILAQLKNIDTYETYNLSQKITAKLNELTGMDILEETIITLEADLLKSINSESILKITEGNLKEAGVKLKEQIEVLKKLYGFKNQINMDIQKANENLDNPAANIDIHQFSIIKGKYTQSIIMADHGPMKSFTGKLIITAKTTITNQLDILIEQDNEKLRALNAKLQQLDSPVDSSNLRSNAIAVVAAVAPVAVPDPAVMTPEQFLNHALDSAKGSIILQSEFSRKELITKSLNILTATQAASLADDQKLNGLYPDNGNDRILVINVKRIHNAMVNFECLMEKINSLQSLLLYGRLTNVISLNEGIKNLKKGINEFLNEIKLINDSLLVFRQYVEHGVYDAVKNNMNYMLSKTTELSSFVQLAGGDLQGRIIDIVNADDKINGKIDVALLNNQVKALQQNVELLSSLNSSRPVAAPLVPSKPAEPQNNIPHKDKGELDEPAVDTLTDHSLLNSFHVIPKDNEGVVESPKPTRVDSPPLITPAVTHQLPDMFTACQRIITSLRVKLTQIPMKGDGTYDLEKITDAPLTRSYAALINAVYKANDAGNALVKMSEGHNITGFFSLISHLSAANNLIADVNLGDRQNEAKKLYYDARNEIIAMIKLMLTNILPDIKKVVARTTLTELMLGINPDNISLQLRNVIDQLDELAKHFDIKDIVQLKRDFPFNSEQLVMLDEEIANLNTLVTQLDALPSGMTDETKKKLILDQINQLQSLRVSLSEEKEKAAIEAAAKEETEEDMTSSATEITPLLSLNSIDDKTKIHALNKACIDYKHHLKTAVQNLLRKKYPGVELDSGLSKEITLPDHLKNDKKLTDPVNKYNAVHAMQAKLYEPKKTDAERLHSFNTDFLAKKPMLEKSRTSGWIKFLRIISLVFIGTLIKKSGFFGVYGKKITNEIGTIQKPLKNKPRI